MTVDPIVALSIRLFMAGFFALAVWHKLNDVTRFTQVLRAYFRGAYSEGSLSLYLIAVMVIMWELGIVAAAVTMRAGELLSISASTLLLLYAVAMGVNIVQGNRLLDCGCSWGSENPVSNLMVLRNLLLAVGALTLLIPIEERMLTTFEIANAALLAFCTYLVYLAIDQLINNHNLAQEPSK